MEDENDNLDKTNTMSLNAEDSPPEYNGTRSSHPDSATPLGGVHTSHHQNGLLIAVKYLNRDMAVAVLRSLVVICQEICDNGHHMTADRLVWSEPYKTSGVVQIKSLYPQSASIYPRIDMPVTPITSHSEFQRIVRGTVYP